MKSALSILFLFFQTLKEGARNPWRPQEISHAIVTNGIGSLPIISISTAFAGLVVSQEMAWHMHKALSSVQMVPGFTGQFIFRELGIAIPGLLLVAKVGASTTAEVGTMQITEQIDALKLLGISPVGFLVYPRLIASIFSTMALVMISIFITLSCAMMVTVFRYHFSILEYIAALKHFLTIKDLYCALIKGFIFGGIIPIVSCSFGFRCEGGAQGVGTATTQAVVTSTSLIILVDFILTYLFSLWV